MRKYFIKKFSRPYLRSEFGFDGQEMTFNYVLGFIEKGELYFYGVYTTYNERYNGALTSLKMFSTRTIHDSLDIYERYRAMYPKWTELMMKECNEILH